MTSAAIISTCGTYRYTLQRPGRTSDTVLFVMLNPSTADASVDDPTIRRCRGFAAPLSLFVVNLFAFRATDPRRLLEVDDPVGPENDHHIAEAAERATSVVCAWGARGPKDRVSAVEAILRKHHDNLWCLGSTKGGHPRHPLYLANKTRLQPWVSL